LRARGAERGDEEQESEKGSWKKRRRAGKLDGAGRPGGMREGNRQAREPHAYRENIAGWEWLCIQSLHSKWL
jgi:hypothetical protein